MKHIKDIDATYHRIHFDEFKSKIYTMISQRDIDIISNTFHKEVSNVPDPDGETVNSVKIEDIHLLCDADEWFYVVKFIDTPDGGSIADGLIIYKCDQIDGVIDCLKDILI